MGGIHPQYHKELARDQAISTMPLPPLLRVSMSQHLGAPAIPAVKKGDAVQRGQLIGEAAGFISAAVHAPTSGTVKAVASARTAGGAPAMAIDIEPDGEDAWDPAIEEKSDQRRKLREAFRDDPDTHRKEVVALVADAGVAGMGGAGFPTSVKLSPPPDKPIDILIINGAECEPYLAADHRLMVEHAADIWAGVQWIRDLLGAKTVRIAIEDNKPESIQAMRQAIGREAGDTAVAVLPTEYPQGAEKQQIYGITGRQVPSGGLPMDVGCLVENVATALAIRDAIEYGRPLTERVTSVTGQSIANPGNVLARIGTPYADLVEFCGGLKGAAAKIISGGPMMGFAQASLDVATTKTTSGVLALPESALTSFSSMPCISCGRCVDACPMNLVPSELSQMLEAEDYETAEEINVMDCIECGCCAFVCPAHRPLVQHMRQGKSHVALKRRQQAQKK
jgi:electron transport complex protein RnfC